MRKFTKKQLEAIDMLILDIDELVNKPRRLYHSLEDFAFAFDKKDAVPSIREAQNLMYRHKSEGEIYSDLFDSLRVFIIEEWEWQVKYSPDSFDSSYAKIRGAEEFVKKHIKRLVERRFN